MVGFRPTLFMLLSTLTLALNGLVSKFLTDYFPTEVMVLLRLLLPALLMLSCAYFIDWKLPTKQSWRTFFTRGFFIVCCQACFLIALTQLTLIEAVVLFSTGPLFIPIIERILFKTTIHWIVIPTFALMFTGMLIQNWNGANFHFRPALVIGVCAGLFNACSQVTLFRASQIKLPVLVINGWCFTFATMLVLPVVIWQLDGTEAMRVVDTFSDFHHHIPWLLLFLGISTTATQFFRSSAYRLVRSNSELAPLIYTNLVFAVIFQILFFDSSMSPHQIMGTSLIVFATILNTFGKRWFTHFHWFEKVA